MTISLNPKNESTGPELPRFEAGCKMPTPTGIVRADEIHKTQAEMDNISFLNALHRYFENGGRA